MPRKKSNKSHLVFVGRTWYIKMRVPVDIQSHYGSKTINRSTRTDSLTEAEKQLQALLYEFELIRERNTPASAKDTYRKHLAYLKAIIDEANAEDNKDILASADFDINEKTPEPIAQAIGDAHSYYNHSSMKKARFHDTTYGLTLREALELEEQRIDRLAKDTGLKRKRNTAVNKYLSFVDKKDVNLKDISRRSAHEFVDAMLDMGKSHKTIRNYLAGLQGCWDTAARYEHVESHLNPFKDISVATTKSESYKPLKPEHIKSLLEVTKDKQHPFHDVFRVGLVTGARINEIANLTSDDIVTVDGVICMDIKEGKTATSERAVPLCGEVGKRMLRLAEGTEGYLFPYFQNRGVDYASSQFQKLRVQAGVTEKGYVFHSLRHNMATALERTGVPEHQINRILGHKITNMSTGTYSEGLPMHEVAKQISTALQQPDYSSLN